MIEKLGRDVPQAALQELAYCESRLKAAEDLAPFTGLIPRPAVLGLVTERGSTPPFFSPLQRAYHAFQPFLGRTGRMVFLLASDVFDNPGQIFRTETKNPVAELPSERAAVDQPVVDVMTAGAFEFPQPLAGVERRRNADG